MPLFDDFTIFNWVLLTAIILFAGLVHGTLGIGFPLIATPLIAMMTDVRSAMVMLLLPTLCNNLANTVRGGNWDRSIGRFWPLALWGAAALAWPLPCSDWPVGCWPAPSTSCCRRWSFSPWKWDLHRPP